MWRDIELGRGVTQTFADKDRAVDGAQGKGPVMSSRDAYVQSLVMAIDFLRGVVWGLLAAICLLVLFILDKSKSGGLF